MYFRALLYFGILILSEAQLTFKNVLVTCETYESSKNSISFGTIVTAARLKPHLPSVESCYKISIDHSEMPNLYPNSFSNIKTKILFLGNNNIRDVYVGAFKNLEVTDGMSLQHNKLTNIYVGVFNNVKVPVLYLSYNWISYIDYRAFDNMTDLKAIHLDHNQLTRVDMFWFSKTPQLQKLTLNNNLIREIQEFAFAKLDTSPHIDLSQNNIWNIDKNAFQKTRKYNSISLAHNQLTTLEPDWLKGIKVGLLDISGNKIQCLRNGLAGPSSVNYIDGNPWICDCLWQIKRQEGQNIGNLVAPDTFQRCSIL